MKFYTEKSIQECELILMKKIKMKFAILLEICKVEKS